MNSPVNYLRKYFFPNSDVIIKKFKIENATIHNPCELVTEKWQHNV